MKSLFLILTLACALAAETKQETELKKQLAATEAALSAERTRVTALQKGTQKLTEAVAVQTETSQDNARKIEAAAARIIASEANDKRLVETVKSQADATQKETKKLADVVTSQSTTITHAITAQTKQQERSLVEAQKVARELKESNRVLARTAEENRLAKEENARQLIAARADIKEIKFNQALAAAKDDTALRMQRYKLISDISTPFIQGVCGILLALVVVFQIKATRQASATHTMVNGERTKMLKEIEDLKRRIERGDDRENGHAST